MLGIFVPATMSQYGPLDSLRLEFLSQVIGEANARAELAVAFDASVATERTDRDNAITTAISGEIASRDAAIGNATATEISRADGAYVHQ